MYATALQAGESCAFLPYSNRREGSRKAEGEKRAAENPPRPGRVRGRVRQREKGNRGQRHEQFKVYKVLPLSDKVH